MTLMTLALLLLAAGLALLGITLLVQVQQRDRSATVADTAINRAPKTQVARDLARRTRLQETQAWLTRFGEQFEGSRLERLLLAAEDCLLLDRCDANTHAGRAIYLALRLIVALVLLAVGAIWQNSGPLGPFLGALAGLALGLLVPKLILGLWASRTARRADDELPLLVDLLRLLQGIGMSMDQSLHVIADQFRNTVPLLGHELKLANTSYHRGRSREQSLQRLTRVYDNDDLRALVRLMVQVDEHGGAVQEPLQQFGTRLRERRKMRMKEASGKLSVKMTVVMMLTLLPALMLVLAGPAAIALIESMSKLGGS